MTWKDGEFQPRQERAQGTKDKITDAALALFGEKGFHATNTKEIASRAGVATGTLYRYFVDKKALFIAVCTRMEKEMTSKVLSILDQLKTSGAPFPTLLDTLLQVAITGHRHHELFHREVLAMQILDSDIHEQVKAREARVKKLLYGFLESHAENLRVADLDTATEILHMNIEEAAHQIVIFKGPIPEDRMLTELRDMLLCYLVKKK